eukprot:gnl/Dysnectes_brevis/2080_a2410_1306.p1 GENE.gnl/Dysnectes_brevis/2080_a2410_1306~~gnl/Dysnectes_brevis/2080_a2410_1306.p1  ORF type:complete len:343 (+),score=47.26 gnl/Dysnectes_brevis/2080_a2410_1306:152-1180(+)
MILSSEYDFELQRCVDFLKTRESTMFAAQFPEGLMVYATPIVDYLEAETGAIGVMFGDVVYGACCIDDVAASLMGLDCFIHFGHSKIVDTPSLPSLYIRVKRTLDVQAVADAIVRQVPDTAIGLTTTAQFSHLAPGIAAALHEHGRQVTLPRRSPLPPGEILGCTCPQFPDVDCIVSVVDGLFHLEAAALANPDKKIIRLDPTSLTIDQPDCRVSTRITGRREVVRSLPDGRAGVVLGTLGRQGSVGTFRHLYRTMSPRPLLVVLPEVFPHFLSRWGIAWWVQLACPRLSLDWGDEMGSTILLNAQEAYNHVRGTGWEFDLDKFVTGGDVLKGSYCETCVGQ